MLYCDNYLFKRIEHIFKNMFQNSQLMQVEKNREVFCKFVPYLYDLYINNIYRDLITKNNILKSQNYLSSLHKIVNFCGINTFEGVDQFKVSLILRNKYYVIMNVNNLRLDDSDLSGAYLRGTFNQCEFPNVNFCRCDIRSSYINSKNFNNCKLSMVYGKKVCFNNSKLTNFKVMDSNLEEANFNATNFDESIIRGIDFSHAVFNQCLFENTRFIDCNFSSSSFLRIKSDIKFYECCFSGTKFIDISDKLRFHDCCGDYTILKSTGNGSEDENYIVMVEDTLDCDSKVMKDI